MADPYTTRQGDTWDIIAFRIWENEKLMHHLVAANPGHQGVVFFSAGIELNVPDIEIPQDRGPKPPWQK